MVATTGGYEDETTDSESTNDDIHTVTQAVINDIDFDSEFHHGIILVWEAFGHCGGDEFASWPNLVCRC